MVQTLDWVKHDVLSLTAVWVRYYIYIYIYIDIYIHIYLYIYIKQLLPYMGFEARGPLDEYWPRHCRGQYAFQKPETLKPHTRVIKHLLNDFIFQNSAIFSRQNCNLNMCLANSQNTQKWYRTGQSDISFIRPGRPSGIEMHITITNMLSTSYKHLSTIFTFIVMPYCITLSHIIPCPLLIMSRVLG
jgi:hypothetical protein